MPSANTQTAPSERPVALPDHGFQAHLPRSDHLHRAGDRRRVDRLHPPDGQRVPRGLDPGGPPAAQGRHGGVREDRRRRAARRPRAEHGRRRQRHEGAVLLRGPARNRGRRGDQRRQARRLRRRGSADQLLDEPAGHPAAVPHHRRDLLLPALPDAGRRQPRHAVRQVQGQARLQGVPEGHLRGRRRGRRGDRGARGDQGLPQGPGQVPRGRRAHPQRRSALRPSRHRQDAARAGDRRRGGRAVLHDLRLGLRRDVRRRRREPRARPVRAGEAELAGDHLHRRDRRGRPPPRHRHRRRQRRARADPQPAARGDGRLRPEDQRHPHRRHQPARRARPGAAAPRPLRPADRRRLPRHARPQADPRRCTPRASRWPRASTSRSSRARRPASPAPTSRTCSTRRRC